MRVAQNHLEIGMAEQLTDGIQIHSRLDQSACKVMAQVVEMKIPELREFTEAAPGGYYCG